MKAINLTKYLTSSTVAILIATTSQLSLALPKDTLNQKTNSVYSTSPERKAPQWLSNKPQGIIKHYPPHRR